MFVEGIYDLLIDLKQYPYLEARREYIHTMTIMNITEYLSTIVADEPITIGRMKHKLSVISAMGYAEDGGFPILSDGDILEGYIATSEVTHGLEQLEKTLSSTMDENEISDVPCYFNKLGGLNSFIQYSDNHDLKTPVRDLLATNINQENVEATSSTRQALNDFSQYIDHVSHLFKKREKRKYKLT
jgi:chloride channel 3/4/5